MYHLIRHGTARTPLHGAPTVDKRCSAVHRGVSYDGRFVGGGAHNQEPDGDTRHRDSDLDRFGSSDRHNTLRPMSLVYYIDLYIDRSDVSCPLGDPCLSLYSLEEQGYTESSIFGTIQYLVVHAVHALILWAGPPLMVRPMSCLVDIGGHTPTASPRA